jgi:hypothetical protein
MTLYEIKTDDKVLRSCAENESVIRGERGDSELAFDKISSLLAIPESYKTHIETTMDTLLFNNPSLKKYAPYESFNESSLDYNLQPRKLGADHIDTQSYYKENLYNILPLSLYNTLPIRELDKVNCLIADGSLDYLPDKLNTRDERDLFIKSGNIIDEDNYIHNIAKEDENKLLDMFEAGDDVIKAVREVNKLDIYDYRNAEKVKLENNLQAVKRKWMSTLPTLLENYNSSISNPNNKFII